MLKNKLKFAIPNKGRLSTPTLELFELIGFKIDNGHKRLLSVDVVKSDLKIFHINAADIPEYVQDGIVDLGITGYDLVKEKGAKIKILKELNYGEGELVIAVPNNSKIKKIRDLQNKKIATSYPNLARNFLRDYKINADIIEMKGAVENAPFLGLSEAIIDLSSTGETLVINNLKEIKNILETTAVLIANHNSLKSKAKSSYIKTLLLRIESITTAKKECYIMMNASENILEKIKKIAPGLSAPSVIKLSKPGMIAVHSVIPRKETWRIIEELKKIGASGILIIPIERLIF